MSEWISVDDRKPEEQKLVLVALLVSRFHENEDGSPYEEEFETVDFGQYVSADTGDYFEAFASPHGDQERITHWMEVPAPPRWDVDYRFHAETGSVVNIKA